MRRRAILSGTLLQDLKAGYADHAAAREAVRGVVDPAVESWVREDLELWRTKPSTRGLTVLGHNVTGAELLILGLGLVVLLGAGK